VLPSIWVWETGNLYIALGWSQFAELMVQSDKDTKPRG
jgi:hypothetical protein